MSVFTLVSVTLFLGVSAGAKPSSVAIEHQDWIKAISLWPQPQQVDFSGFWFETQPSQIVYRCGHSTSCPGPIRDALRNFKKGIFNYRGVPCASTKSGTASDRLLTLIQLDIRDQHAKLQFGVDESYSIEVSSDQVHIQAANQFGALYALETLSQMVMACERSSKDTVAKSYSFYLPEGTITDRPRFPYRGFLLDTSRHFIPLGLIFQTLDTMFWNKLNLFHWHIVDDQSFPWVSSTYPELSRYGAYAPNLVYTPSDVQRVIAYAKDRGIRVLVELDTPGHSLSWGKAFPDILSRCFDASGASLGRQGPLDPTYDGTYKIVGNLLSEIKDVFDDQFIHLGGDEVDFTCWQSDPDMKAFMDTQGISSYQGLEAFYLHRVLDQVRSLGRTPVVWQDMFDDGVPLEPDVVVHVWKWFNTTPAAPNKITSSEQTASHLDGSIRMSSHSSSTIEFSTGSSSSSSSTVSSSSTTSSTKSDVSSSSVAVPYRRRLRAQWAAQHARRLPDMTATEPGQDMDGTQQHASSIQQHSDSNGIVTDEGQEEVYHRTLAAVTAQGHYAILSAPWYLDWISYGQDWVKYWTAEPLAFEASDEQKQRVLGGEACMWTEYVDATNLHSRTWPRASAVAERLWSPASLTDVEDARHRLVTHRCRMVARGLPAEPVTPGVCPSEYLR